MPSLRKGRRPCVVWSRSSVDTRPGSLLVLVCLRTRLKSGDTDGNAHVFGPRRPTTEPTGTRTRTYQSRRHLRVVSVRPDSREPSLRYPFGTRPPNTFGLRTGSRPGRDTGGSRPTHFKSRRFRPVTGSPSLTSGVGHTRVKGRGQEDPVGRARIDLERSCSRTEGKCDVTERVSVVVGPTWCVTWLSPRGRRTYHQGLGHTRTSQADQDTLRTVTLRHIRTSIC